LQASGFEKIETFAHETAVGRNFQHALLDFGHYSQIDLSGAR
jgi:hypothetical protein